VKQSGDHVRGVFRQVKHTAAFMGRRYAVD
jgi:hypothetical protein